MEHGKESINIVCKKCLISQPVSKQFRTNILPMHPNHDTSKGNKKWSRFYWSSTIYCLALSVFVNVHCCTVPLKGKSVYFTSDKSICCFRIISTLIIKSATLNDAGYYHCEAKQGKKRVKSGVYLKVINGIVSLCYSYLYITVYWLRMLGSSILCGKRA